jgi:hypothetical protein
VSHATHANAALTPRARLRAARLIIDHGWPPNRAAERYDVSWRTAVKWANRYREEGPAGMVDRQLLADDERAQPAHANKAVSTGREGTAGDSRIQRGRVDRG